MLRLELRICQYRRFTKQHCWDIPPANTGVGMLAVFRPVAGALSCVAGCDDVGLSAVVTWGGRQIKSKSIRVPGSQCCSRQRESSGWPIHPVALHPQDHLRWRLELPSKQLGYLDHYPATELLLLQPPL